MLLCHFPDLDESVMKVERWAHFFYILQLEHGYSLVTSFQQMSILETALKLGIQFYLLLSPSPCFIFLLYLDLYVLGDDTLIS